jgi:Pentapeptide repeats (8 copies)
VTILRRRNVDNENNQLIEYGEQDSLRALPKWETDPELQKVIDLREVDLRKANFELAFLKRAMISGAHFEDSNLTDAHLERCFALGSAFDKADLRGAHLQWAYLALATFRGAQLQGTDLRHTYALTQDQLDSAQGDESTQIPPNLTRPTAWLSKPK